MFELRAADLGVEVPVLSTHQLLAPLIAFLRLVSAAHALAEELQVTPPEPPTVVPSSFAAPLSMLTIPVAAVVQTPT